MRVQSEDGFTLVELLATMAILAVIIAPLTLSFITGLRVVGKTDQKFTDSRGALISAANFSSDVENANVMTTTNSNPNPCGSGGTLLVTFAWSDATQSVANLNNSTNRVTYYYDASSASNRKLIRRICKNGSSSASASDVAVSLGAAAPTVSCYNAGAPSTPVACNGATVRWVKMAITAAPNSPTPGNPSPAAFSFTLAGTRRAK